jgi:hypothetical protein
VRDELRRLEACKRDLDAALMARQDSEGIVIHPNLPELYRKKVGKLQQALQYEATRPQVVETIRSLVDRIEVSPSQARGYCEVTIVGALAQILAFGQKTTAASKGGGGTSLMVAGSIERPMQRAYLSIFAQRAHRTGSRLIVWRMEYPLPVRPGGFWPCTD